MSSLEPGNHGVMVDLFCYVLICPLAVCGCECVEWFVVLL